MTAMVAAVRTAPAWSDRVLRTALTVFLFASLVALALTFLTVRLGAGTAYEANPLMAALWSRFSFGALFALEVAARVFIVANTFAQYPHLPRATRAVTVAVAAVACLDAALDGVSLLRVLAHL